MRDNLNKGVNLQTYTKVTCIRQASQQSTNWVVESERGSIECGQVVHASNAYSSALEPSLRGLIWPTPHMCNKVVPPITFAGSKALQNSYGVLLQDGALFSINPRCTADGIVLFGGSNPGQRKFKEWLDKHPDRCVDDGLTDFKSVTEAVREFAESQFPDWTDPVSGPGELYDYSWSGIIALVSLRLLLFDIYFTRLNLRQSGDGVPFIGQLPGLPGQWICAGHNGQ